MPYDFIKKKLYIGFDPKLLTKKTLRIFFGNNLKYKPLKTNLVDKIWKRKIKNTKNAFYSLPDRSIDNNYISKINKVVLNLKKRKADYQFITASENNAWMLNIRGQDSEYTPIPHGYVLIDKLKNTSFFCDPKKISHTLKRKLKKINFINIKLIDDYLFKINNKKFIIYRNSCSIYFEDLILKKNKILEYEDPIYFLKSIKSKKEIENIKKAHIDDGVALTKYIFWVKKNFNKKTITEISASNKLLELRKRNKKFKFLSFPTISGTGPNGSIIHYKATKKTNRKLKKGDIYLVDSGGQYDL